MQFLKIFLFKLTYKNRISTYPSSGRNTVAISSAIWNHLLSVLDKLGIQRRERVILFTFLSKLPPINLVDADAG